MTATQSPEASVMFSLAELADLEQERLREEQIQHAAARSERERTEALAQQAEREAEAARAAAVRERRAKAEREEAAVTARAQARRQAAIEVARLEAESRAQLDADNARRAHELELLRVKEASGRGRLRVALGALLVLMIVGSAGAAWGVRRHAAQLELQSQRLRDDRFALSQVHQAALSSMLAALDARHRHLRQRATAAATERARQRAEAERTAIEAGGVDGPKLRALSEALDGLEAAVLFVERVAAADRRLRELSRWAEVAKRRKLLATAQRAAAKVHAASAGADALAAYRKALDELVVRLATRSGHRPGGLPATAAPGHCTDPHDPMCGFDGSMIGGG